MYRIGIQMVIGGFLFVLVMLNLSRSNCDIATTTAADPALEALSDPAPAFSS